MAAIYKYPIPRASEAFELKIKGFCEVVNVGEDGDGVPCIWAQVNPDNIEESWTFRIVATGEAFNPAEWCHVRTFGKGPFIWHLLRPVEDWNPTAAPEPPVGILLYIIGARIRPGLPNLGEPGIGNRFHYTYADAKEAFDLMSNDLKSTCAIFSVHAVIQQEVTCESLF